MKLGRKEKKPWPTKAAMEQIYSRHLWGGDDTDFYSGEGSHIPELVDPYIEAVRLFLTSFAQPITVCDLGCGDFNVGKQLAKFTKKYTAVDIVPSLIERNKEQFTDENVEFHCLDLAKDMLPIGDCAIVRHVLQHLSNGEVQSILKKLAKFKYLVLTEHVPGGTFFPNKEIISGQGIRIKKQSGVDILAPPFNFHVLEETQLLKVCLENEKGNVITTLYTVF